MWESSNRDTLWICGGIAISNSTMEMTLSLQVFHCVTLRLVQKPNIRGSHCSIRQYQGKTDLFIITNILISEICNNKMIRDWWVTECLLMSILIKTISYSDTLEPCYWTVRRNISIPAGLATEKYLLSCGHLTILLNKVSITILT